MAKTGKRHREIDPKARSATKISKTINTAGHFESFSFLQRKTGKRYREIDPQARSATKISKTINTASFRVVFLFARQKQENGIEKSTSPRKAQRKFPKQSTLRHFESFSFLRGKNRKTVSRNRPASAKRTFHQPPRVRDSSDPESFRESG
jgi:hypothetical protein